MDKELETARANAAADPVAYAKAINDKEKSDQDFFNRHKILEDQMVNQAKVDAQKIKDSWHSTIDPLVSSTGDQIKGLIEGTETWGQALKNIGETALGVIIDAIERIVENWIVSMIVGKTSNEMALAGQAALAGAGGVASMAAAPFPFDLGAPAFGSAMFAAASVFHIAGFEKGVGVVPNDMIAQIHEGERVMTKSDNSALGRMLDGDSGGSMGDMYFGDTHVHTSTPNGPEIISALKDNRTQLMGVIHDAVRGGWRSSASNPFRTN